MNVNLGEVWRDKSLLDELKGEILKQKIQGWRPWEILLPPNLIYPMLEEVSQGMLTQWSPTLFNTGVQVGNIDEIAIRFVRAGEKESPVLVKAMPYKAYNKDAVAEVEVNNGHKIRV